MFAIQPAAAHSGDINILGFQYGYALADIGEFDLAATRYVSTPAGPVEVADTPSVEGVENIVNRDQVPHTFTQCIGACETAAGVPGTSFDVALAPGESAEITLPTGTHTFMCTVHTWMRGEITVTG